MCITMGLFSRAIPRVGKRIVGVLGSNFYEPTKSLTQQIGWTRIRNYIDLYSTFMMQIFRYFILAIPDIIKGKNSSFIPFSSLSVRYIMLCKNLFFCRPLFSSSGHRKWRNLSMSSDGGGFRSLRNPT